MKQVERFIRDAEPVRMTAREKALIRERLSAFMAANPAVEAVPSPYVVATGWTNVFSLQMVKASYVRALAAIVLVLGTGMSVAAEGALPGEPLYAVKVNFNEQVAGILALSPEARAEHETSLAEKRLKEAASLSAQGRLTTEARTVIENDFENHVENIERETAKLASRDDLRTAVAVKSDFESALRVHEKVLLELDDRSGEAQTMASVIRQELTSVSQSLNSLEHKMGNEMSVEAERQARLKSLQAEKRANDAREYRESMLGSVSAEAVADADGNMQSSLRHLSEGYSNMERGLYNKAFVSFQKSIKFSRQAELTLAASHDLKIDLAPAEEGKGGGAATTTEPAKGETSPATATTTQGAATSTPTTTPAAATTTVSATGTIEIAPDATTSADARASLAAPEERHGKLRSFLRLGL